MSVQSAELETALEREAILQKFDSAPAWRNDKNYVIALVLESLIAPAVLGAYKATLDAQGIVPAGPDPFTTGVLSAIVSHSTIGIAYGFEASASKRHNVFHGSLKLRTRDATLGAITGATFGAIVYGCSYFAVRLFN